MTLLFQEGMASVADQVIINIGLFKFCTHGQTRGRIFKNNILVTKAQPKL